jgi:UDP-N-acetylglucosamine 2-epimerase (non-hydrolysing)
MVQKKILFVFGTRPEAIKLAPVIKKCSEHGEKFKPIVVVTAQHREMLNQMLHLFRITPDYDLDIMSHDQTLVNVTIRVLQGLDRILTKTKPDCVIVQGDTTTTFIGALAAFYHRLPLAHVEAGLRTYNLNQPYPEEANRVMTSSIAGVHFAPTRRSRENLLKENVDPSKVFVTGNTVIDALFDIAKREYNFEGKLRRVFTNKRTRKILLTTHRRENHGQPMERICHAILEVLNRFHDVELVFPVHLSPRVQRVVSPLLKPHPRAHLIQPLDYETFVNTMKESYLILTDSGGVQEESPSFGKPVLVLRETTERPEAVEAGTVKLVGTDYDQIVQETGRMLSDRAAYEAMSCALNPYGDGMASERIVGIIDRYLNTNNIR